MGKTAATTAPMLDQLGRWVVSDFGPPSVLKWEALESLPTPSNDDVLVSILVSGASGADNLQRVGGYPDPRCEKPGFTPGYDFVGEIKALGPTMYGTCSASKFDFVKSLGVTPIDRRASNVTTQVRELTGGRGVDVAYDSVGSRESLQNSQASAKDGSGQVVCYGVVSLIKPDGSGMLPFDFDPWKYILEGQLPGGSVWAVTHDYYYTQKELFEQDFRAVAQKVREGKLQPSICKLFPLSDVIRVNELLASGEDVRGKMEFVVDLEIAKANKVKV
ncbi:hypothetical protein BDR22DRAFT_802760 [Usnea florida]